MILDKALGFAGQDNGVDDVDDAVSGFDVRHNDGRPASELVGEDTSALMEGCAFQGAELIHAKDGAGV
jgi:hypothetical protein